MTSLSLFTFMHWKRKWQPTPVFLPGESQGRGSLVGCCLWGRTESDTTEATQQQHDTLVNPCCYKLQHGFIHSFMLFHSPKACVPGAAVSQVPVLHVSLSNTTASLLFSFVSPAAKTRYQYTEGMESMLCCVMVTAMSNQCSSVPRALLTPGVISHHPDSSLIIPIS